MRLLVIFLLLIIGSLPAHALSLIRDAEIEATLRAYSDPIFEAAGLEPENVRIFIVQDPRINAYVAGGANIFIHTGLLMATEKPGMLLGVIAHEAGHISGAHLARGAEKLRGAQLGVILGYVLGAAAGAAGGGDAAAAIMAGSQQVVERNLLSFSRAQEQSADQAALGFLDRLQISASGMLDVFSLLKREEQRRGQLNPYMQTHPLSGERIIHVREHVERSKIAEGAYPKKFDALHARMLAKLRGFIDEPRKTLARYPESDPSVEARMARAVAYYKIPEVSKALKEVDILIQEAPNDPFFHELKGQILYENGRAREALGPYEKANALLPDSPLLLTSLAEVRLALSQPEQVQKAIGELEQTTVRDATNSQAWRMLATAYGRAKDPGRAALALAEEALLQNNTDGALRQATLALQQLPEGTPARLRAEDIKRQAEEMKEHQ